MKIASPWHLNSLTAAIRIRHITGDRVGDHQAGLVVITPDNASDVTDKNESRFLTVFE
jgi:hypothetical protein